MDDQNSFLNAYKKKLEKQQPEQLPDTAQTQDQAQALTPSPGDTTLQARHYEERPTFVAPSPVAVQSAQPPRRSGVRRALPLVVISVVLIAIAVFLIWFLNRGVAVVDLRGWVLSDAQIWASDNKINLQVTEAFEDTLEAGKIISQDPQAGARIDKGGFLKIKVSLGHDLNVTLPLPNLLGMTMTEVEAWSKANYMTKVRITTEYHKQIPAGRVIRYEINDDTVVDLVKRSTPIYVIVSKGPEPKTVDQVTLPNFKEMSVVQSQQFAREKGLVLKLVEAYDELTPAGTILDQSIAADQKVDAGSEVILTVSKGKKVIIPDFSSVSKERATAVAAELGITVAMKDRYSSRTAGQLLSQSLAVGTIYAPGDVLELVYSLGNRIVISSFVGQTRAAIETWAKELNDQGASIRISVTQTQNNAPRDTILYQDKTNQVIGPDTTIRITVSLGKMVFVPDLVAPEGSVYGQIMTRASATAACEAVGLIPVFVAEARNGRLPGEIWSQSVAAGKEVYQGTTIVLKYTPVNTTMAIPVFTGKMKEQIISEGYQRLLDITFLTADAPVPGSAGLVIGQSVKSGEIVAVGTAITLTISPAEPPAEPDPTPTTAPTPSPTPSSSP